MLLYRSAVMLLFQSTLPREERLFRQLTITDRRKIISIHAPTRGATYLELANEILGVFQSTLPREERRCIIDVVLNEPDISIHAPTRGATHTDMAAVVLRPYFNPRSHERSDGYPLKFPIYHLDFNPRSHERSDFRLKLPAFFICISIHSPTRGAT